MWLTDEEETRARERKQAIARLSDPSEFSAMLHCGHHSPEDGLPDYAISGFLAWRLAKGVYSEWKKIEEESDELEITVMYGYSRTELYLATEKK